MAGNIDESPETPSQGNGIAAPTLPLWRQMLGDELRRLRHKREETLYQTAKNAKVSPQYLSEMERGVKDPSSEMIEAVAGALDVTSIDLARAVVERFPQTHCSAYQTPVCQASFTLTA